MSLENTLREMLSESALNEGQARVRRLQAAKAKQEAMVGKLFGTPQAGMTRVGQVDVALKRAEAKVGRRSSSLAHQASDFRVYADPGMDLARETQAVTAPGTPLTPEQIATQKQRSKVLRGLRGGEEAAAKRQAQGGQSQNIREFYKARLQGALLGESPISALSGLLLGTGSLGSAASAVARHMTPASSSSASSSSASSAPYQSDDMESRRTQPGYGTNLPAKSQAAFQPPRFLKSRIMGGLLALGQAAQRKASALLSEMAQTKLRQLQTAGAEAVLHDFAGSSAIPRWRRAKYARQLARLHHVIGQEQTSPELHDTGGRIVNPDGSKGPPRRNDPAKVAINIASDSGRGGWMGRSR